jgi:hypothetical protein
MYEGLRDHYGIEVENFKVHAYAEADHGDAADYLLRQVAITATQQRRDPAGHFARSDHAERPDGGAEPVDGRAGGAPVAPVALIRASFPDLGFKSVSWERFRTQGHEFTHERRQTSGS